ncbi:hypothetical protein M440DRAFT_1218727 [Trichoderma longibrachiatum ATCC 18648]|uniref:Uncharacterized protein n=1 Tax=Trichoderma longibrachiatum ATCC 18648 TaxID=983965 RepID=A0A2T4C809_TRILO|nr:hypothetical protein M440DRAFT_1218727 [Trichoderma longibrachiatum ATCC 18648]
MLLSVPYRYYCLSAQSPGMSRLSLSGHHNGSDGNSSWCTELLHALRACPCSKREVGTGVRLGRLQLRTLCCYCRSLCNGLPCRSLLCIPPDGSTVTTGFASSTVCATSRQKIRTYRTRHGGPGPLLLQLPLESQGHLTFSSPAKLGIFVVQGCIFIEQE